MPEGVTAYFEDNQEAPDLGRLALRGGTASVLMQYANGVLQLGATVILARLLAPEDFGLVAIITVLTSFAPLLIDFGLGDATTQKNRISRGQVSSLFWLSCVIGVAIALVVAACSLLIAWVFGEPRIGHVSLCFAITFVLFGGSTQHFALLRRRMKFGIIAGIQIFSTFVGAVIAVFIASCGYGYWSLVLRPIASSLCLAVGAWLMCPWRPGFPVFDKEVKSMLRFGLHVVGFSVTYSVSKSLDRIALGLFYRPDQVGYYQNATVLYESSILSTLVQLHTVGSAALSKLQSNPAALRQRYEAALSALAFFAMPAAAILSVTARDLTVMLLGERWHAAGSLLSIIALRGIFQVVEGSQGWLHLSIGRADRWRNWGVVSLVVQVVAVLGGLPFGVTGVAVAVVTTSLLLAVPSISYAGGPIGIGKGIVLRAVGQQLIGAISAAAGGWWLQTTALTQCSGFVRIALSTGFCAAIYLIIVVGLFRLTEPIKVARAVVQGR